ncbi:MAG: hypothetical protein KBE65_13140 [Phycisphaerae bacterium]|nr:hypothetical protein [Phycisphaerae bacterium]
MKKTCNTSIKDIRNMKNLRYFCAVFTASALATAVVGCGTGQTITRKDLKGADRPEDALEKVQVLAGRKARVRNPGLLFDDAAKAFDRCLIQSVDMAGITYLSHGPRVIPFAIVTKIELYKSGPSLEDMEVSEEYRIYLSAKKGGIFCMFPVGDLTEADRMSIALGLVALCPNVK